MSDEIKNSLMLAVVVVILFITFVTGAVSCDMQRTKWNAIGQLSPEAQVEALKNERENK